VNEKERHFKGKGHTFEDTLTNGRDLLLSQCSSRQLQNIQNGADTVLHREPDRVPQQVGTERLDHIGVVHRPDKVHFLANFLPVLRHQKSSFHTRIEHAQFEERKKREKKERKNEAESYSRTGIRDEDFLTSESWLPNFIFFTATGFLVAISTAYYNQNQGRRRTREVKVAIEKHERAGKSKIK